MKKESIFNFSEKQLRQIRRIISEPERRVIIGFNKNEYGKAVVSTGVPVMYKPDEVSYVKKRTMSYEKYMIDKERNPRRR